MAHALQRSGKTESEAIQIAVGVVKRWAAGIGAKGKRVHPDVQAAAARAVVEWEAAKARAHATSSSHANDSGRFLDLAFTEALAERVPPGRPEGGRFVPAVPALGRHDTPEQTARAVNAMERPQRAAVRATTLPPPGLTWTDVDRLAVAVTE